jgi:hypothetical protein
LKSAARSRTWTRLFGWVALVASSALSCSKSAPSSEGPAAASASVALAPSASTAAASPAAQASVVPPGSAPARMAKGHWRGAYVAKVGAVVPPKGVKETAWVDDPGTTGTGKGTIDLVVGEPAGEARGELKGPLGELVLAGTFDGHELYADLRSAQPNAAGALSGVMTLIAEGPAMKGTARLSGPDGKSVREAELQLTAQ